MIRARAGGARDDVPGAGAVTLETLHAASCSAGRGWSRPTARRSTRARSTTTRAIAFDGACLRGKCEADPALGYDLLKLLRAVFVERLQATRLRLLDLYGDAGG